MTDWTDVIVRARGLSSRLLPAARLEALCGAADVAELARRMATAGLTAPVRSDAEPDALALETALGRRAGARMDLLARWTAARRDQLAPIFDDEDRRSIRAVVRGALAGIPAPRRTTGLVPTPSLPIRALEALSRAGDVATVGVLLLTWRHPFAPVVVSQARRQQPDLLEFEVALVRALAARACAAADSGDLALRRYVERTIDLANLQSALAVATQASDLPPGRLFVTGGSIVTVADLAAARDADRIALAARLAPRVRDTPLAAMLAPGVRSAEDSALDALVEEFAGIARDEPLGLAPVILFVLRQRAELHALLRILWGVSLGVPRAAVERLAGIAA